MSSRDAPTLPDAEHRSLRSIEAAAVAGIAFAALNIAASVALSGFPDLTRPDEEITAWFDDTENQARLIIGLNLMAFSGIAFLWFVAVIRRRVGQRADRFFSTVFRGSAILYLGLSLTGAAAYAAPALAMAVEDAGAMNAESATLASGLGTALLLVIVPRIQAVFVFSTSTLVLRAGALPRWVAYLGYVAGAVMLIFPLVADPLGIVFPVWVFAVSVAVLVNRARVAR